MKIDSKFIIRVAGTLTAICLVVAALLGGVNAITADKIEAINLANTEASLRAVAGGADEFRAMELTGAMTAAASSQGGKLTEAYEIVSAGEVIGHAFKVVASGSQGNIEMIVGVDGDGRVLGHGFCVLQRQANTRLMVENRTLYIDDICVDEAARGRGVGRAIYAHILDRARGLGCYNVTLNVWCCNPGAMAFCEKLGLAPYKVGMEQIL